MRQNRPNLRGFTLIEILVVVAIIAVLMGIIIAGIGAAQKSAQKAAATAQLGAIRTGLAQYFSDFNTYPESTPGNSITAGHGASMLAQGLLGYLPGSMPNGIGADGAGVSLGDASDMGFRLTKNSTMGGKIYGPYAPSDPKIYNFNRKTFVDPWGNDMIYYRSSRSAPGSSLSVSNGTPIFGALGSPSYFVANDCNASIAGDTGSVATPPAGSNVFFTLIRSAGTPSANTPSTIEGQVTGATSYLLISAGPDQKYFTADDMVVSQ